MLNVWASAFAVSQSCRTYGKRRLLSAGRDQRTGNGVCCQQVATNVRETASAVSRSRATESKNVCFPQHDAFAHKVTMSATIPLLVRSTFTRRAGPITVRNFRIGPVLSLGICRRGGHGSDKCRSRTPLVFAFCKPVEEFDPRPVRNNIGDAQ